TERMPQEGTNRRELAADRRRRQPPPCAPELRRVLGEGTHVDVLEPCAAALEPRAELFDVEAVGPTGRVGQCGAVEKPLELSLHCDAFAAGEKTPLRRRLRRRPQDARALPVRPSEVTSRDPGGRLAGARRRLRRRPQGTRGLCPCVRLK